MTTHTTDTASRFRNYKTFLDLLSELRYVRLYPVTWGTDPAVYRTQLRGTQARGFTCVHCDRLSGEGDHAFIPIGHVIDTPECGQLFRHIVCPRDDASSQRPCSLGCGLLADEGDIYCAACRSAQ